MGKGCGFNSKVLYSILNTLIISYNYLITKRLLGCPNFFFRFEVLLATITTVKFHFGTVPPQESALCFSVKHKYRNALMRLLTLFTSWAATCKEIS